MLGVIDARGQDELAASLAQLAGGIRPAARIACATTCCSYWPSWRRGSISSRRTSSSFRRRRLAERLEAATGQLADVAEQMASRLTRHAAEQVVLVGPPNVGKSSLFNALVARCGQRDSVEPTCWRPAALVSPERGTTRDYLTATIELDGIRCELVDTAGVDERGASFDRCGGAGAERRAAGCGRRSVSGAAMRRRCRIRRPIAMLSC